MESQNPVTGIATNECFLSDERFWDSFQESFERFAAQVKQCSEGKNFFYKGDEGRKELLLLTHGEISEVTAAIRAGYPMSDKIDTTNEAEELADAMIYEFLYAATFNIPIFDALRKKFTYNVTRPPKHGGKMF